MAKKKMAGGLFSNWFYFSDTFANMVRAVLLLRKNGVEWHSCANRHYVPKYNVYVTKEEWDSIPA